MVRSRWLRSRTAAALLAALALLPSLPITPSSAAALQRPTSNGTAFAGGATQAPSGSPPLAADQDVPPATALAATATSTPTATANGTATATPGTFPITYAYRGDGLRHSTTAGGVTTTYTWDVAAGLPVVLQDGTYSYVYGLGGSLISQTDAAGAQTYYLADGLGSTAALTDAAGAVTATYQYDAFGAVRASTGTGSTAYRFTGSRTIPAPA